MAANWLFCEALIGRPEAARARGRRRASFLPSRHSITIPLLLSRPPVRVRPPAGGDGGTCGVCNWIPSPFIIEWAPLGVLGLVLGGVQKGRPRN